MEKNIQGFKNYDRNLGIKSESDIETSENQQEIVNGLYERKKR